MLNRSTLIDQPVQPSVSLRQERLTEQISRSFNRATKNTIDTFQKKYTRWEAVSPDSEWSIPMFRADFLHFTSKSVQIWPNLPVCLHTGILVIGLNVRRNQPQ
jgi:hypothetical protein